MSADPAVDELENCSVPKVLTIDAAPPVTVMPVPRKLKVPEFRNV